MNSGDADLSRPARLLRHIATYNVTLRAIASKLFCNGKEKATDNLFEGVGKRISAYRISPQDKRQYYVLGEEESNRLHAKKVTGKLSPKLLYESFAVLAFCHASATNADEETKIRRSKASPSRLKKLLGFVPAWRDAVFVIEQTPETYAANIIVPGAGARPNYSIEKVMKPRSERLLNQRSAHLALRSGKFRFVVLVHTEGRKDLFSEAIKKAVDQTVLSGDVRFDVVIVPDLTVRQ